jgi:hypothetical protein
LGARSAWRTLCVPIGLTVFRIRCPPCPFAAAGGRHRHTLAASSTVHLSKIIQPLMAGPRILTQSTRGKQPFPSKKAEIHRPCCRERARHARTIVRQALWDHKCRLGPPPNLDGTLTSHLQRHMEDGRVVRPSRARLGAGLRRPLDRSRPAAHSRRCRCQTFPQ